MTKRNNRPRTVSIADDDRARIPFAMIAVLLLVTSLGAIAVLEQRSDPVIDQEAELGMDRSVTAAQSELRSASIDASHSAVSAPLITARTDTGIDAIDSTADDHDENFENYLKLLIYLEAYERLPAAGQTVGTDTKTTVSIPKVTEDGAGDDAITPDEAIDRVDLVIGDYADTELEAGLLEVTIEDVEIHSTATATETRPITVTVGAPVKQLDERTTEYESQLDADFFDADLNGELSGLGQHSAARLYLLAYFKAGWDRFDRTARPDDHDFERVLEPEHTEVLMNDAIFDVQHDVFGTKDPYADRTMRPKYVCMSYQMLDSMERTGGGKKKKANTNNDGSNSDSADGLDKAEEQLEDGKIETNGSNGGTEEIDIEEQLCGDGAVQNWLFGDSATGELPDVPEPSELLRSELEEMEVMNEEERIPFAESAEVSYTYYAANAHVDEAETYVDQAEHLVEQTDEIVNEADEQYQDEVEESIEDEADPPDIDTNEDRTIGSMTKELYDIGLDRSVTDRSRGNIPQPDRPGGNYSLEEFDVMITNVHEVDANHDALPDSGGETIHEIDVTAAVDLEADERWVHDDSENASEYGEDVVVSRSPTGDVTVETEVEIQSTYDFYEEGMHYDDEEFVLDQDPNIEYDYQSLELDKLADQNRVEVGSGQNFEVAFRKSPVDAMNVRSYATIETDLESSARRIGGEVENSGDIEEKMRDAVVSDSFQEDYDLTELEPVENELIEDLRIELERTHDEFTEWAQKEDNAYTVERTELLDSDAEPITGAIDHIKAVEDDFVYADLSEGAADGEFETTGEYLTAQIRKAYFDRLYHYIERIGDQYEGQVEDFEDEINEMSEGGTNSADEILGFAQDVVNADVEYDPGEIEGSPVLDDAQFEISGSPTYMTHVNISREQDPAIRPENKTITDFGTETEHVPMTIQSDNRAPWPGVPITPYPPQFWFFQTNTWNSTVKGEYARFEVSASVGSPADTERLTYVREHRPIEVELHDGTKIELGKNEPITFESSTEVIVIMPGAVFRNGGVPAVADTYPEDMGQIACSPTWGHTGPNFDSGKAEERIKDRCDFPEYE
ncbi:DUF7286 family protein [Halopiger aswanensis]|uniref:Uncharacterized protein n=1 Tax=Halopiger aswanensis TaxID=148449 RepID=A0A419WPZ5_9EURY|nr:hypothetical protein [Halopiger aswanensis]RKD97466.1 hypothetical protein ATJ93_0452 [Halopiger aswanensis]